MAKLGTKIESLDTPCLLVDLDRMENNIYKWQRNITAHNVKLRPHVKTHKVPEIAKLQLQAGASGITVAKVSESEVFAANGIDDIFIAYPVIGIEKWRRVADLAKRIRVIVGVDSETGARGLSEAALQAGVTINVRLEINQGLNRSGVKPDHAEALCKKILSMPGLNMDGIFGFRGIYFPGAENRTVAELGREEGEMMAALAEHLRSKNIPIENISIGSTPTAQYASQVPGITELRPGTYIFSDYMMAEIGTMSYNDVALSILCTVVSRPDKDRATIDGGSKTFCGDINPDKYKLKGYAKAVEYDSYIVSMSEEHGVMNLEPGINPSIGDKIRFYPIHVCTAVNLADELIGIRNGKVEIVWPILARGKRT